MSTAREVLELIASRRMAMATFRHLGPIHWEEVEPWHYAAEAQNVLRESEDQRGQRSLHVGNRDVDHLHAEAERLHRIAVRHSWTPSALRQMSMREKLATGAAA